MECLQKKEPLYIGLNNNMDTILCLTKNEFNIRENSEPAIYNSLNIFSFIIFNLLHSKYFH